jgi:hypothetical protein
MVAPASSLHTLRLIAGVLPALLVVVFAGVIALAALVMNDKRQAYALAFAQKSVDLATVLVGISIDRDPVSPPATVHALDQDDEH